MKSKLLLAGIVSIAGVECAMAQAKMTPEMTEWYTPEVPVVTPGTVIQGGGFTAPSDAIVLLTGKTFPSGKTHRVARPNGSLKTEL